MSPVNPLPPLTVEPPQSVQQETQDFVLCNCYAYVARKMKLPLMSEITPNTTPKVGAVAIFYYGSVKHVAIITSLEEDGFTVDEANYSHCLKGSRKIAWNDTRLRGFYEAGSS